MFPLDIIPIKDVKKKKRGGAKKKVSNANHVGKKDSQSRKRSIQPDAKKKKE